MVLFLITYNWLLWSLYLAVYHKCGVENWLRTLENASGRDIECNKKAAFVQVSSEMAKWVYSFFFQTTRYALWFILFILNKKRKKDQIMVIDQRILLIFDEWFCFFVSFKMFQFKNISSIFYFYLFWIMYSLLHIQFHNSIFKLIIQ